MAVEKHVDVLFNLGAGAQFGVGRVVKDLDITSPQAKQIIHSANGARKYPRILAQVSPLIDPEPRPESIKSRQAGWDVTIVEVGGQAKSPLDRPWDAGEMVGRHGQVQQRVEVAVRLD